MKNLTYYKIKRYFKNKKEEIYFKYIIHYIKKSIIKQNKFKYRDFHNYEKLNDFILKQVKIIPKKIMINYDIPYFISLLLINFNNVSKGTKSAIVFEKSFQKKYFLDEIKKYDLGYSLTNHILSIDSDYQLTLGANYQNMIYFINIRDYNHIYKPLLIEDNFKFKKFMNVIFLVYE